MLIIKGCPEGEGGGGGRESYSYSLAQIWINSHCPIVHKSYRSSGCLAKIF